MKIIKSLLCYAVALLCIACAKPEIFEEPVLGVSEGAIVGSFENIETKAGFGNANSFLWSKDDALKVLTNKKCREYVLVSGAGCSTAYFVGAMGDDETLGGVLAYPYDAVKTLTATTVEMILPASYAYTQSFTFGKGSDSSVVLPCYAPIEGTNFTVKHLGGYVIYEIHNIPDGASKFVLKTTNRKRINGAFSADLASDSPAFVPADTSNEDEQTVEINFSLDESSSQCFIVPVPQGEYSWVWDMYSTEGKLIGHGRQDNKYVTRGGIVGFREQLGGSLDYIENGVNFGKGIAVLGDWDGDESTPNTTLYWAPINCGYEESGEVNTAYDRRLGKLYQWGAEDSSLPYMYDGSPVVARSMFLTTATPSPWYDNTVITGTASDKWNDNQGPCPKGWRLPTSNEFKVLCEGKISDYGSVNNRTYACQTNAYSGAEFFGANSDKIAGNGVFLPTVGYRNFTNGEAYYNGSNGGYWSSTTDGDDSAYIQRFSSTSLNSQHLYRAYAFPVRCVSAVGGEPQYDDHEPVVLATLDASDIKISSAICGGNITSEGNSPVTERGICYSAKEKPTIYDSKIIDHGTGLGSFQCKLSGLIPETVYYYRAYAINDCGVYYGEWQSFMTTSIDYIESEGVSLGKGIAVLGDWNADGNETILYWAPVNCGYEEDGAIGTVSDHRLGKLYQWGAGDSNLPYKYAGSPIVALELYYDAEIPSPWYGFSAIKGTTSDKWNNNQGPCPAGWRLPTLTEFQVLCVGKNGSYGWMSDGTYARQPKAYAGSEFFGANVDKTPGKGVFFPASGSRSSEDGSAGEFGSNGYYWSSTPYQSSAYTAFFLDFSSDGLDPTSYDFRANAFTVRCVSSEEGPQEVHKPVVITTSEVKEISLTGAICGGNITSEGDSPITERGVCYSVNSIPSVYDTKVNAITGSGLGTFVCNLTGLTKNTKYYVRAYAINANGTYYGNIETFTTIQIVPDYIEDGVNFGKGTAVLGDWNEDGTQTTLYWAPVNCGYEEKGTVNSDSDHRLGKLYQWGAGDASLPYMYNGSPVVAREMYYDTATPSPWYNADVIKGTTSDMWNNNQGPCPDGWRLPTTQEFQILCAGKNGDYGWVDKGTYAGLANTYAGAEFFGANADKTAGNGVFFPAAGYRHWSAGTASYRGLYFYHWSSTPNPNITNYAYTMGRNDKDLYPQGNDRRAYAFSVRCVTGEGDPSGEVHKPAVLTTAVVNKITSSSAICGGSITFEGDSPVTERGVCYSTVMIPTIKDSKVIGSGAGLGAFQCELSGLAAETKYYVRAYAINANGVYYGELQTFKTSPLYFENGVNLGPSIAVLGDWNNDGTQTTLYWAPVNCGYEATGTVNSNSDHRLGKLYQWGAGDSSLPYKYNGSPVVAREMYYDTAKPSPWYDYNTIKGTASDKWNNNQGPCPEGWRLPTPLEFEVLCAGKNGSYGWVSAGTYASQINTYAGAEFFGANTDKTAGTGVFFPAAGQRFYDGSTYDRGSYGYYWSSTPSRSYSIDAYFLYFRSSSLNPQNSDYRASAQSVRCVSE